MDLIKSPSYKIILKLSFPVIIGMLMHYILAFADRFFISKLGINQAAGTSLSGTLYWVLMSFTPIITGGTSAIVSRKVGEQNNKEATEGAEQSILLSIVVGLLLSLIAYFSADFVFDFFNAEKTVSFFGLEYYKTIIIGYPFLFISVTTSTIFQSAGDTKTPMFIFSMMCLLNTVLDPIFIFGYGFIPELGVKGGAIATVLAEIFAFVYLQIELLRFKKIKISPIFKLKFNVEMSKRLLKVGLWSGLNGFSRPVSAIILQKIIVFHGTKTLAAFSFGLQWVAIIWVFLDGVTIAITTIVGQYIGAKKIEWINQILNKGLIIGTLVVLPFSLLSVFFGEYGILLFSSDLEVVKIGTIYLIITMSLMIFDVLLIVYTAAFNGAGDTKPPMIISFVSNWIFKILFAYITTYVLKLNSTWVWIAISLSFITEGLGLWIWFKKGKWKEKIV